MRRTWVDEWARNMQMKALKIERVSIYGMGQLEYGVFGFHFQYCFQTAVLGDGRRRREVGGGR